MLNGCRVAAQVRSGLSWRISSNFTVRTFCQASGLTGGTHLPLSLLLTLPVSLLVPLLITLLMSILISPYMSPIRLIRQQCRDVEKQRYRDRDIET